MKKQIIDAKGDIFEIFISMYDFMDDNCLKDKDMKFYKNIFENLKTSEDSKIIDRFIQEKPKTVKDYYEYINTTNLKVNSKKDLELVEKVLFTVTTKAIVMRFKNDLSKEEARADYIRQIEFLKYGILK